MEGYLIFYIGRRLFTATEDCGKWPMDKLKRWELELFEF